MGVFFFALYLLVPRDGSPTRLLHALGMLADRPLALGAWSRHVEHEYERAVLERWIVALAEPDGLALAATTVNGTFTLRTSPARLVRGGLRSRPEVFSEAATVATPGSVLHRTERVRAWYRAEKRAFAQEVAAIIATSPAETDRAVRGLLERLEALTPVRFTGADLARFGNFEIVEPLVGDYSSLPLFDGAHFEQVGDAWQVRIRLRDIPECGRVSHVRARVRGGAGSEQGAIVHDALHSLEPDGSLVVNITEPPGWLKLAVYDEVGRLIDSEATGFWRHIGISVQESSEATAALPQSLRQELARPMAASPSPAYSAPWIQAELEAASLQRHLFAPFDPDFHAFAMPAEHRAFIAEYLLTRDPVIIADPYFDVGVLREYVRRERGRLQGEITIVISYTRGHATLAEMQAFCARHAQELPDRLRILNVTTPAGGRGAFHDRFAVVGRGEAMQTWHLGSSINSYSRRYPLFAARVRGQARDEWARYVHGLVRGEIGESLVVTPEVVFEQHQAPPWQLTRPAIIASLTRRIPYWATLLDALAPASMRRPLGLPASTPRRGAAT